MSEKIITDLSKFDHIADQLIDQYDDTVMPLPEIGSEPHLLISKVRKHYMDYIVKLLSINYENNQKLLNKNIYLPSAIWRCAKSLEMNAAYTCMMVQLYRKNIVTVIKELKNDTMKGRLNKNLYEFLHRPPQNEKRTQTTNMKFSDCTCQCNCNSRKRRRKASKSPQSIKFPTVAFTDLPSNKLSNINEYDGCNKIPVIINSQVEHIPTQVSCVAITKVESLINSDSQCNNKLFPEPTDKMCLESQDPDDLMMQLEKLFQGDPNDDDLFDGALCDNLETVAFDESVINLPAETNVRDDITVAADQSTQIKSLDDRLASLAGLLVTNTDEQNNSQLQNENLKNKRSSKWLCEEYYLKVRFLELLDEIGESNRKKLARIKLLLLQLFGDDSDDDGMISPLNETSAFVLSCKERIAPWVVKLLTPYYIKGRIKGKTLFKALAKHLIRLIYQCSHYPHQYEVHSFVTDFLENHKMITCEADFMQFRIENI